MAECILIGNSGGGSGKAFELKTTGYTAGSTLIDNLAVPCQPFIAGAWSGALSEQVSQGTDGIALGQGGYIKMPFTGFHKTWSLSVTVNVSSFASTAFSTIIGLFDTADREFGISYQSTTDRLFYAVGAAEKLSADVVDAQYSGCYLDNAFPSANIIGSDITFTIEKSLSYLTVLVNDSPRIRLSTSLQYLSERTNDERIMIGCTMSRSDIQSFSGEVKKIELD